MERLVGRPVVQEERGLSQWGEAIVAAATGDAAMMRRLLLGELDDGSGIDLRTFRTSNADVNFVYSARNILIDPHYTLVEIAVERDHFDVVMALTEEVKPKPVANKPPPVMARSVSTFVPRSLADQLRDEFASRLEVLTDGPAAGLAVLRAAAEGRDIFMLPNEVMALPLEQRQRAIGMLLEDPCARARVQRAPSNCNARPSSVPSCCPGDPL